MGHVGPPLSLESDGLKEIVYALGHHAKLPGSFSDAGPEDTGPPLGGEGPEARGRDLERFVPPAKLLESLEEVVAGGAPMSPEVARRVIRLFREIRPPEHASYDLTPQETELLKLLVDGHHKKTAAVALGISVNTVSFHLKNVYAKLQVHSKTEAVAKAFRERLI